MRRALKSILSLFIVYHLLAIVLFPNPDSVITRQLESYLLPYGNFLGLNTTWRFFSPNPGLNTVEYEAVGYSENGDISFQVLQRFPAPDRDVSSRESLNRMMSLAMILSTQENLANSLLKPFLCGRHPKADEIYVYQLAHVLPTLDKAQILGGDRELLTKTERLPMRTLRCERSQP